MPLSTSKEALLHSLNQRAQNEHATASEQAARMGRQPPPAPVPLVPAQIEFPKWLYRGWKPSDKGGGHHEAKESKLVKGEAEHASAIADGWSEEPPKAQSKK